MAEKRNGLKLAERVKVIDYASKNPGVGTRKLAMVQHSMCRVDLHNQGYMLYDLGGAFSTQWHSTQHMGSICTARNTHYRLGGTYST